MDLTPEIVLVGRVRRWQPRARADQAGSVWMAWVQVPQVGRLGVYVLPKATALSATLPQGWVRIRGQWAPRVVQALGDDPRSARAPQHSLLLIHAVHVLPASATERGWWCPPQTLRVQAARPYAQGYLARSRAWPDIAGVSAQPPHGTLVWQHLTVVITRLGPHRYLRYLVHATS